MIIYYEIDNVQDARKFLLETKFNILLVNKQGSASYYGARVIDKIFSILQEEFGNKIVDIIFDAHNDRSAFITAKKLGYKNILYNGNRSG